MPTTNPDLPDDVGELIDIFERKVIAYANWQTDADRVGRNQARARLIAAYTTPQGEEPTDGHGHTLDQATRYRMHDIIWALETTKSLHGSIYWEDAQLIGNTLFDALVAVSAPPAVVGREQLARLIDPVHFEEFEYVNPQYLKQQQDQALDAADRILAAFPSVSPPTTEEIAAELFEHAHVRPWSEATSGQRTEALNAATVVSALLTGQGEKA